MSEAVTTRQQELAGKYRPYPEYKDSGVVWLGEMPSTWVLAKTARYFKIAMGQTILKEQLEDDGEWPVYSATEGDHYFGRVNNPQVRLGCGDLVIPARGNSIGFVKLVKEQVTTTQTTIYCKHLTQKIYPEYAYYFMVGQKKNLFWFTQTAIPQITVEEIGSNPILLPSFEEQRTIAAFLDYETARIDRLIAQQQRLIELLKEKRQAVISHAVTKGLKPHAPMKDSGVEWLGQVPEHWDVPAIKYIVSTPITDGPHETPEFLDSGARIQLRSATLAYAA
ncbi:restriction endonuclease subunit S [Aeromonas veronii]